MRTGLHGYRSVCPGTPSPAFPQTDFACLPLPPCSFHFTIHGLWPNYKAGGWPQFCDADYKFDTDDIDDIEGAMEVGGVEGGIWCWGAGGGGGEARARCMLLECGLPAWHAAHAFFAMHACICMRILKVRTCCRVPARL